MRSIDEQEVQKALTALGITEGDSKDGRNEKKTTETRADQTLPEKEREVLTEKTAPVEEEREYTDFEKEQMKAGWNPKGEKSAEEWARNAPLYDKLHKQSEEMKRLHKTVADLTTLINKKEQQGYEKAKAELEERYKQAQWASNKEEAELVEQEYAALQAQQPVVVHPAVTDFVENNKDWYGGRSLKAMEMTTFANEHDRVLRKLNLSVEEHMALLDEHIREKFPDYFNKSEQGAVKDNQVESGYESNVVSAAQRSKKVGFEDLPKEYKDIIRNYQKFGVINDKYTLEAAIKDLLTEGTK